MSPRSTRLQFVALGFAVATAASAAPDASLLAAARAAEPAVVESLEEMVSIESGTMDLPGLARMTDYAERRLRALGMQVERRASSTGKGDAAKARARASSLRSPAEASSILLLDEP